MLQEVFDRAMLEGVGQLRLTPALRSTPFYVLAGCCLAAGIAGCHRAEPTPTNPLPAKVTRTAAAEVARIEIVMTWIGLGRPASARLELTGSRDGGLEGSWSHREGEMTGNAPWKRSKAERVRVEAIDVESLADAVNRPCLPTPTLAAFGVTMETLRAHVTAGDESLKPYFGDTDPPAAARSAFARNFVDAGKAQKNLELVFHGEHTDDFPGAEVTLHLANGATLTAASSSQLEQMLPWQLTRPQSAACKSYDPAISRAVSKLMPEAMLNRQRLTGTYFYNTLADEAVFQMRESGEIQR